MATKRSADKRIKAAETMLDVVDALDELGVAGVTELADYVGVSKSTVHYHLKTLREREYTVREDGGYRLGFRFLDVGERARHRLDLYDTARSEVDKLAVDTGELAILMVEEHGRAVYLYMEAGAEAVDLELTGARKNLHDNALGKAYLSELPRERVEEILDERGMPRSTENTVCDREELYEQLDGIRDRGVALDREEQLEGLRCVATAITLNRGDDKRVLGSICVAGPVSRMQGDRFEETLPDRVLRAGNVVELSMS